MQKTITAKIYRGGREVNLFYTITAKTAEALARKVANKVSQLKVSHGYTTDIRVSN